MRDKFAPDVPNIMATVAPWAIIRARIIVCDSCLFPFLKAINPPINTPAVARAPVKTLHGVELLPWEGILNDHYNVESFNFQLTKCDIRGSPLGRLPLILRVRVLGLHICHYGVYETSEWASMEGMVRHSVDRRQSMGSTTRGGRSLIF